VDLNALQAELERIYDISTPHRVVDFLLHDPAIACELARDPATRYRPETLLVSQSSDSLDVSLYLSRGLLARLERDNPTDSLHAGNLQDFWFAMEGVSHFMYLVWNATFERRITQLELELVAEVDKFITAVELLRQQHGNAPSRPLRRALFEDIRFRSSLGEEERQRYREANRLAARYCHMLEARYKLDADDPALMRELRRFYRMPRESKFHHIETGAARAR
jgi:hypothetical protein